MTDDLRVDTGNWWLAVVVALAALGGAVWFFAGADEAALAVPTFAERLDALAAAHPDDADLLVVPEDLPAGWGDPGVETVTDGDRLVRFEARLVRSYEDPDTDGAFRSVRVWVCSARSTDACRGDRAVVAERTVGGVTTVVALDDGPFVDVVAEGWADVELTPEWRSLDWPTRLR